MIPVLKILSVAAIWLIKSSSLPKIYIRNSYATRNALSNFFYIPKSLHVHTDQLIRVTGPKIWNALPRIIVEKVSNV